MSNLEHKGSTKSPSIRTVISATRMPLTSTLRLVINQEPGISSRAVQAADGRQRRAALQKVGLGGAGLPVFQGDRPSDTPDSTPHRRTGSSAHFLVSACLLR